MNEPFDQSPEIDPLTRQAIAWLVRLKSGEATAADAVEFRSWRSQSPEHEAALKRAVKLWQTFEKAAANAPSDARISPRLGRFLEHPASRRALIGGAIAASTAAYLLARPPLGLWPSLRELSADYRTGKGEQMKLAVVPGLSLDLGTLTSIAVEKTSTETRIELIDGEAAVTADGASHHRFVILADGGSITAEKADFDARCVDGIVSVTCATGSVGVERDNRKVELAAGQSVSYNNAGLGVPVSIDVQKATSWRAGILIFTNKPLSEVVDEINRYLPGHIFITSSELKARIVNGTFHRDRLDTFVGQVQQLFGAKVTALPGGVTLLS